MLKGVNEMVEFLDRVWDVRDCFVPCLIGGVGIGKTAAVNLHAEHVGAKVVTIIASQVLPSEVSGITMPDSDTKSMKIYDHYRLSSLQDGDILFFDELLEADQSVLSACLTLIESRQMMSGKKLPDIQIIAACNPTCEPCMIKESIRQRFMWVECEFDPLAMFEYIKQETGMVFGHVEQRSAIDAMRLTSNRPWNFLTPRTLTKLCRLMATAKHEWEAESIFQMISEMFSPQLAKSLKNAWLRMNTEPRSVQIIEAVKQSGILSEEQMQEIESALGEDEDSCMSTIIEKLMSMPEWDKLAEYLDTKEIK